MQRLRLFSICSNSSQRNSIFILYNKGAVREEQKNILPRCHAGNENRASPEETGRRGPFKKHCPLLMRGNSQGGGQTTNHLLTAANVWEFSYTASAAFSSFPRRWLFLFGYGSNLSVSLRSPAPLVGEPLAKLSTLVGQPHVLGFTAGGGRRCSSRGALGIPLCLHRYSVTVPVHTPLTVANLFHESPSFPSDTRPERGSGLFLRQKP